MRYAAGAAAEYKVSQTRNMTPVELDANLRDALRRYRATRPTQSHQESALDAVVLVSDIGGDALLTLDGRLLQDSPFDGLSDISSIIHRRSILFLGARRTPNWLASFRFERPRPPIATSAPVLGGSR